MNDAASTCARTITHQQETLNTNLFDFSFIRTVRQMLKQPSMAADHNHLDSSKQFGLKA